MDLYDNPFSDSGPPSSASSPPPPSSAAATPYYGDDVFGDGGDYSSYSGAPSPSYQYVEEAGWSKGKEEGEEEEEEVLREEIPQEEEEEGQTEEALQDTAAPPPAAKGSFRRDSLADRLSSDLEATKTAYVALPSHQSFRQEDSPYSKIDLSDPEKVNDHTTFKLVTVSKDGKRTYIQQRRYLHFEWLFNELTHRYPGVIVPPIPAKKAIGRFNADFVETRRYFLERFLRKINSHPILMGSKDFKSFIETPQVEETVKTKGFMQIVGGVFTDNAIAFAKSQEDDKWHDQKRTEVTRLENQLRKLQKKVDAIVKQRKELGSAVTGFWNDITSMKEELPVFENLSQLGAVQLKVEDVHQRESSQYVVNFGYTVEEYLRVIDSIKIALNARATCCRVHHLAIEKLQKKKEKLDRTMGQIDKGDAVTQAVAEVEEAQKEFDVSKKNFEEVSATAEREMARFDEELARDLDISMRAYVAKMIEAQDEITQWWSQSLPHLGPSTGQE